MEEFMKILNRLMRWETPKGMREIVEQLSLDYTSGKIDRETFEAGIDTIIATTRSINFEHYAKAMRNSHQKLNQKPEISSPLRFITTDADGNVIASGLVETSMKDRLNKIILASTTNTGSNPEKIVVSQREAYLLAEELEGDVVLFPDVDRSEKMKASDIYLLLLEGGGKYLDVLIEVTQ